MPLSDSASAAILTSLPAGQWTQLSAVPAPVEHGFDTLEVTWLADFRQTVKTALQISAMWPQGKRYGTADFWLRSGTPERLGGNVWRFAARYEGRISTGKGLSVRMGATNEVFNIDNVTYLSYTDIPANVREASPSIELGYVLVDGSPPTAFVGLEGSPTVSPGVRVGFWGNLAAKRLNWPHNWVLTDVDVDRIANSSANGGPAEYVRETWQYFQQWLPA